MIRRLLKPVLAFLLFLAVSVPVSAAPAAAPATPAGSSINVSIPLGASDQQIATPIKVILVITLLTFLPALLVSCTSFTRIIVVFSFLRQALGLQSSPPNQVLIGLSLFMTFAVMSPVFQKMHERGIAPYLDGSMNEMRALDESLAPLRDFMYAQTRGADLNLMLDISRTPPVQGFKDLPTSVLIPAFILSELKTAFEIGFMIYIPFVVIDMVVAMILLAMGMMVLPPVVISMPFKIMLFVVVDGWDLVVSSLVKSFR
jgi:flagellar biosynthetic protein FliP